LVVARLRADDPKMAEAIERAAELGGGAVRVLGVGRSARESVLSTERACPTCGRGFPELDPRFFSFNTRQGACPSCEGKGVIVKTVGRGKNKREVAEGCTACGGTRLSPLARAVTLDGKPITSVLSQSVRGARKAIASLKLSGREAEVGKAPLAELERRLAFLDEVGVGYLGLDRPADTL